MSDNNINNIDNSINNENKSSNYDAKTIAYNLAKKIYEPSFLRSARLVVLSFLSLSVKSLNISVGSSKLEDVIPPLNLNRYRSHLNLQLWFQVLLLQLPF